MQPPAQFLFETPMGQLIVMWTIIILVTVCIGLTILIFWTMIKGGIPSWSLYIQGGGRFGRIVKCKDTDTAIEFGGKRFLKMREKGGEEKTVEDKGVKVEYDINPPLSFRRKLRFIKLYVTVEGDPTIKSWKAFAEGTEQPALSPEQLKKDPQVQAVNAAVKTFGRGGVAFNVVIGLVLIGFGFFLAVALCASGIIPIGLSYWLNKRFCYNCSSYEW